MCIAQKTLKSMPSIAADLNTEMDDFDEIIYTPKSINLSPVHERPALAMTPTQEMAPSDIVSNGTPSFFHVESNGLASSRDIVVEQQPLMATTTTFQEVVASLPRSKGSTSGSIDAFDQQ
jgi:hypothetical protein